MAEPLSNIFKKAEETQKQDKEQTQSSIVSVDTLMNELKNAALEILADRHPEAIPVIENLQKKHKELYLYFFTEDEFFIYRPLSRLEYKELVAQYGDKEELAEQIVLKGVLYPQITPQQLNDMKAGIVPTLLELILSVSQFGVQNPVIKL